MTQTKTKDFYDVLGVAQEASTDEIRKAYRKLAHKYHPDKTGHEKSAANKKATEDKMKEINEAYDVLKNAEKRKEYDREREGGHGFEFSEGGGSGFDFSQASGFGENFGDILSSMFGMNPEMRGGPRPGRDLKAAIRVTLRDVANGAKKILSLARSEICAECHGSGAAKGSQPKTCPDCGGAGQLFRSEGRFQSSRACPHCRGLGTLISDPCTKCEGTGHAPVRRDISVTIPAGIESGGRLRLAGEGEAGEPGAPRGDLYVMVDIEPDPFFKRDGADLVCEVPITFAQAALGDRVTVPTLDGVAKVTVPQGTQNGAKLRLRGMGLPVLGSGKKGDQLVQIVVEVPRGLSDEQKAALTGFDAKSTAASMPLTDRFKQLLGSLRAA